MGHRRQDFTNLLARAELQPPYRVEPLAVDGHLTVLAATGGDGKTWLGFAMAAGVAARHQRGRHASARKAEP